MSDLFSIVEQIAGPMADAACAHPAFDEAVLNRVREAALMRAVSAEAAHDVAGEAAFASDSGQAMSDALIADLDADEREQLDADARAILTAGVQTAAGALVAGAVRATLSPPALPIDSDSLLTLLIYFACGVTAGIGGES